MPLKVENDMPDERNPGAIDYFHRRIYDFDDIYRTDRTGPMAWLNRILRASVRQRFDLAFDLLGDMTGKSVLDVGCGTGRYMFESVRRGAVDVVGLDAAPGALDAARKMAAELGLADKVEFVQTDFMDYPVQRKFDIIFAVGYFDYIFDPLPHMKKMFALCNLFLYASFPKLWHPMTPIRKTRLALNNCPVRFYTKRSMRTLAKTPGASSADLRNVSRDYILIANP
jgi:SAM-dependent methyltransferase